MIEKRKFVRLDKWLTVQYKVMANSDIHGKALCKNISAGGMNLFLPCELTPSSLLELEIDLPDIKPIFCVGRIVWQDKLPGAINLKLNYFETGIEFTKIDKADKEKLSKYISEHIFKPAKI